MNTRTRTAAAVAALIVAVGAGYGAARLTAAPAAGTAAEGEEGHAEEGEGGEPGVVTLSPAEAQAAGIRIVSVQSGGGGETHLAGRVEAAPDAQASVGAALGGRIERLLVAPGSVVRAGQPIAVVISGDGAILRAEADAATAEARAASAARTRDANLFDQGVVARQDVEASQARAAAAEAQARASRARVAAAGGPNASGRATIVAPIGGVVTGLRVGLGGVVQQGDPVATIANPNRVELVFNAPAALAATVRPGARITVQGADGAEYAAVVTAVAPGADAQSGSTLIRARADGVAPPPGSAVSGSIITGGESGIAVPAEAVQTVDGASVVFVVTPTGFRAQPVVPGRRAGDRIEIVRGLTGSERIAGANAFLLKAELGKGAVEDHD
ncbi:MAG: efflux transporter periplasmic adaptor subunit [Sphingomonadales bacterium RIFCSPHIGHO2_01_FULL_65_20]|jgi:cobalt-zinc-cadmium efflux system membrane fusion protein|uniref:efflux RND transporter periplasmic adaptor subunit n=1 Tax=Brevundimonas sp. TaxID=1871086 RepID=UPI0008B0E077|nr:efflux RND transporter periplasmic adaptor subunit [Brevundimonas sp.]OHC96026.1 MAG: efflux transporter periplasmic adaptor subunit [Sphingomonadales bacterium RIFCSPHIGHO2_01_FULL_65_20]TAJ58176.1 MAG: efflux RND transporter periplasmic adaptor subunit [Brevundimonas sp.]